MTESALRPRGEVLPKLHDHHLWRQAMVYVRQSHPQQVAEHIESTARQLPWSNEPSPWDGRIPRDRY